ncbi:MAG: DUF3508 domain-containing protein, partial [Bacteroidota bacterium]
MSTHEREAQLEELALVVLGIRVFNRQLGKGGFDLQMYGEDGARLAEELLTMITEYQAHLPDRARLYEEALLTLISLPRKTSSTDQILERLKDELIFVHQSFAFVQLLAEQIQGRRQQAEKLKSQFAAEEASLEILVSGRASVAKDKVYPKFTKLAKLHKEQKQLTLFLSGRKRLMDLLVKATEDLQFSNLEELIPSEEEMERLISE